MTNKLNLKEFFLLAVAIEEVMQIDVKQLTEQSPEWDELRWQIKFIQSSYDNYQDVKDDYQSFMQFLFTYSIPLLEDSIAAEM